MAIAQQNATRAGYISSSSTHWNTKISVATNIYFPVFEIPSINGVLNMDRITLFSHLAISKCLLHLRTTSAMKPSSWKIGIHSSLLSYSTTLITQRCEKSLENQNMFNSTGTTTSSGGTDAHVTFNVLPLLRGLSSENIRPDKAFYLYLQNTSLTESGGYSFLSYNNFRPYLEIEAVEKNCMTYHDGNSFIGVEPYYFDGTNWRECRGYFYRDTWQIAPTT